MAARRAPADARVAGVREFNRFYTKVIGVLDEGLLRTRYSLTEARVLFELAQHDRTDVADLRRALDIDAGYLSRILARFDADGIATRAPSEADGRRQVARLTKRGLRAFATIDGRATDEVHALLDGLSDEKQRQLVGAMAAIRELLDRSRPRMPFVVRRAATGEFGWVIQRNAVVYAQEYGWDETYEALVTRIVADYLEHRDPRREEAWIAEVDGEPVGCVFCVKRDDTTAQLRLLLVEPRARGMGIGGWLVEECLRFARRVGYDRIVLWTNDVLVDARRIYERAGFELIEEQPHHSFGHDLVGQTWACNVDGP